MVPLSAVKVSPQRKQVHVANDRIDDIIFGQQSEKKANEEKELENVLSGKPMTESIGVSFIKNMIANFEQRNF